MPNPMWERHTAFLLLLFKYFVVYYGKKCLVKFVQKREKEMKERKRRGGMLYSNRKDGLGRFAKSKDGLAGVSNWRSYFAPKPNRF